MVRRYWDRDKLPFKMKYRMLEAAGVDVFGKLGEIDEERMLIGGLRALGKIRKYGFDKNLHKREEQEGLIIILKICTNLGLEVGSIKDPYYGIRVDRFEEFERN
jgi:hypothetical protein